MVNLEDLRLPLPDEAVSPHPTKPYLSSIKAIYVTERFNKVFGIGKWQTRVVKEHVNFDTGMVVVKLIFTVPELDIYFESFGGNDNGGSGSKNFDLGDAYKGASTDALTKIGSFLEVGIDVFKGKHNTKNAKPKQAEPQNADEPEKQWINKANLQKVADWLNEKNHKIEDVRKFYKISNENFETLKTLM
jgi:hypothetical protein